MINHVLSFSILKPNFVYIYTVQCYYRQCIKEASGWKCNYEDSSKIDCLVKHYDICYESFKTSYFMRRCSSKKDLALSQQGDLEKTGKAYFQEDYAIRVCNTPLCNNRFEFPENYTIDKEYYDISK